MLAAGSDASKKSGGVELSEPVARLLRERWRGTARDSGAAYEDFERIVLEVAEHYRYGSSQLEAPSTKQQLAFIGSLHLEELMLARACAEGRAAAWETFMARYRETIYQTAYGIARQDSVGRELADSLYAELYGLREKQGLRKSPLLHYHGRGSLAGWLRSVLAQRFADFQRASYREVPLEEDVEIAGDALAEMPPHADGCFGLIEQAVQEELERLSSDQRFLLSTYYLDGRTLKQIAGVLGVHESTVSRSLARLSGLLRKNIAQRLRRSGLSRREVEEIMQVDVRDLDIQLKKVLQGETVKTFQNQRLPAMRGGEADV